MQNQTPKPGVPGETSQWPRWEGPADVTPRGYLPPEDAAAEREEEQGSEPSRERVPHSLNYRRADREIERDIRLRLDGTDAIDASQITVRVKDGSVSLTGSVRSPDERALALDIAWAEPGVVHCSNSLMLS